MKTEVDLIEAGGGNIGSISRCLQRLGVTVHCISQGQSIGGKHPLLLPGVGAFGATIQNLKQGHLAQSIIEAVKSDTPLLGICIGLQILFEASEESPDIPGLGLLRGKVVRFKNGKVPQIGWNRIRSTNGQISSKDDYVYFVNSYYAVPVDEQIVSYTADYYGTFCAAIKYRNITAFQFHPEKSSFAGERFIKRWLVDVS